MDFPNPAVLPQLLTSYQRYGIGSGARAVTSGTTNVASQAWGTANLCLFVPFRIPFRYPVRKMFWYNFATVAGNVEAAICSDEYVKLWTTGAVAQAGASQIQYAALTSDALLEPGEYRLMMASSSTTATFGTAGGSTAANCRMLGVTQFAAASLPVGAITPAATTINRLPFLGLTWRNDTPPW